MFLGRRQLLVGVEEVDRGLANGGDLEVETQFGIARVASVNALPEIKSASEIKRRGKDALIPDDEPCAEPRPECWGRPLRKRRRGARYTEGDRGWHRWRGSVRPRRGRRRGDFDSQPERQEMLVKSALDGEGRLTKCGSALARRVAAWAAETVASMSSPNRTKMARTSG